MPEIESRQLVYADERISYQVHRSPRRHKTISIRVQSDGSVRVAAPGMARDRDIESVVAARARWIWRHVRQARQSGSALAPCRYIDGEQHLYLGRRLQLKIEENIKIGSYVKIKQSQLLVATRRNDPERVRNLLMQWYRTRALQIFPQRLEAMAIALPWTLPEPRGIRLRFMRKRWGSCSASGVITLNPHLVKAPRDCVDYVICHELCHLREFNHSPRFYHLLDQGLPGWQDTKSRLDGMAGMLLNV